MVSAGGEDGENAGRVLVLGPLPPLIGTAAGHASGLLHMFREAGYGIRSATGPGLAMARHVLNFASESRLRNSTSFLADCQGDDIAVLYVRSFDFAKTGKPLWYKRRLEELRKLRAVWRMIGTYEETALLLDRRPYFSRYQIAIWATARIAGFIKGKPVKVFGQSARVEDIFAALTGLKRSPPSAFRAEETAYDAAFADNEAASRIRLTIARAEQALSFWEGRGGDERVVSELRLLIAVAKKFDLGVLPQFRLLWSAAQEKFLDCDEGIAVPAVVTANALCPDTAHLGVPITRYMRHLRTTVGPNKAFRVQNRKEADRILDWYLFEAPGKVPAGCVPIPARLRDHFVQSAGSTKAQPATRNDDLSYTLGRDQRPFPLSPQLSSLASSGEQMALKYKVEDPVDRVGFVFEHLSNCADKDISTIDIGDAAKTFFASPIGADARNVSRLEFLLALQGRCQLSGREEVEAPWTAQSVCTYASNQGRIFFPAMRPLLGKTNVRRTLRHSVSISGLPRSETGVGSNLHMSVGALRAVGLSPTIYDTADGMRALPDHESLRGSLKPRKSFALHHVNADQIPQAIMTPPFATGRKRINVGFLLWEFDVLPASHLLAMDMLDEIWTPSAFLASVYSAHTDKPVLNMRKGLHLPQVSPFDLSALGVSPGTTTFLTCFDFHSSVARKNPLAAVEAFVGGFPPDQKDVSLIVKTTPAVKSHWGDPEAQMQKIRDLASRDHRIILVEAYYSFNDLLGLIAQCDCLVSPHRAEGFGLMPAYALGLGRAVIATDYSGTTDFCSEQTAFPIPYKMQKADSQHLVQPIKGAKWAEIDRNALSAAMRGFADDPTIGRARAGRGKDLIRSLYSPQSQAERYRKRLSQLEVI